MKKILLLTCLLALAAPILAQQNIILVIADDFGTDYCGFYEDAQDTANLPNIRSLLARGVRFRNAWSNPNCSPTRAGILTGRYAFRTGVGTPFRGRSTPNSTRRKLRLGSC
jgi:arylsulfatase A-like enzyme